MNVGTSFPPADAAERKVYGFDFRRGLDHGETLTGGSMSLTVIEGVDGTPATRLIGPSVVSGSVVKQRVGGLQVGATYRLMAVAATSLGNVKSLWARVECRG